MKNKLIWLLTVITIIFSIIPSAIVSAEEETVVNDQRNFDAYSITDATQCYSQYGLAKQNNGSAEGNYWGSATGGDYVVYKNMDFGNKKARKVIVRMAAKTAQPGKLEFRKDSFGGEVIASLNSSATGSWETPAEIEYTIDNPDIATGVFDLYVVWTSEWGNLFGFQFDYSFENITGPTLTLKNQQGRPTTNVAQARKLSASFSVERLLANIVVKKANMLVVEYGPEGEMLRLQQSGEQTVLNDGQPTVFSVAETSTVSTPVRTKGVGVYVWNEDNTVFKDALLNSVPALTGTASTKSIDAQAYNGQVTISGSNAKNERVIIAVVPNTYNSSLPIYNQNPVQIFETDIVDGAFNYKFKMNEDVPSGKYYAVVKGENVNLTKEFSFTSVTDTYNVLYTLSTEADDDIVASTVAQYADVFGADAAMFANMQSFDKANLNQKIKAFFATNPLTPSTSYDEPWINGLKNIIVPEGVVSYMKNVKNAENSAEYIKKHADNLGISSNDMFVNDYGNCKEEISKVLIKNISATSTASDFITLFKEAVIVGNINTTSSWGYTDEVFKKYGTEIPVDLTVYNKLNNTAKADFLTKFIGQNFTTKQQIKDIFERNINSYDTEENITNSKYELPPLIAGEIDFTAELWSEKKEESGEIHEIIKDFEDIDSVPWAVSSINYMRSMGYVNGKSDTIFAPTHNITREEFVAIVVRCFALGEGDVNSLTFADVNKNDWYAPYLATAVNKGIINGVTDDYFGTGTPITREQIAAIITRTAKATDKIIWPKIKAIAFTDGGYISEYAYDSVMTLAKAQIINGVGENKFSPKKNASRAEAVVMLHRFLLNIM